MCMSDDADVENDDGPNDLLCVELSVTSRQELHL